jgi:hypothetical protein
VVTADGTGLEGLLATLGRSFAEHRGYADHLVGRDKTDFGPQFRVLMGELLEQAQRAGRIGDHIVLEDVVATIWGVRGVVMCAGPDEAEAWQRYLDLHLAGLRTPQTP